MLAAAQYASAGLALATTLLAARMLGPGSYGRAAMLIAFPSLVWSLVSVKSSTVITRYVSAFRANGRTDELRGICKLGYGIDVISAALALVLVAFSSSAVTAHVLKLPHMAWLPVIYGASLVLLSLAGTTSAILSSFRHFGLMAGLALFERGAALLLVVWLLTAGRGIEGLVLAMATTNGLTGLLMVGTATRALRRDEVGTWWRGSVRAVASLRGELRSFFGWNFVTVTAAGVLGHLPLLLLGGLRGPQEAGWYRIASNIFAAGSFVEGALWRVTYPVLSGRWEAGERKSLRVTLRAWMLRAGLPIALLIAACIPLVPLLVPPVLGEAYRSLVTGTQIMLFGAAVSVTLFYLSPFFYAAGKFAYWSKAYLTYSALVLGLAVLVIPKWGFTGMATLTGLGTVVFNISMAILLTRMWSDQKAFRSST